MTELEIMQRAKMYIDKLANGIDPFTDEPVPEGDTIKQIRISRCLFYVSDVLRKVIENGGQIKKTKKPVFKISPEELSNYEFSQHPTTVSEITRRINDLVDTGNMPKLRYSAITSFLTENGFLEQRENEFGKMTRFPTDKGLSIGITTETRNSDHGPYMVTMYNTNAQQFILDHFFAIVNLNDNTKD